MHLSLRKNLYAAVIATTALFPLWAADGRIPISAAPYTISAPGSYYLTQDLSVASGSGININASNVELDFTGHTLTHAGTVSGDNGVNIASASSNVRIHHGTISGPNIEIFQFATGTAHWLLIDHLRLIQFTNMGIQTYNSGASTHYYRIEDNDVQTSSTSCFAGIYLSTGAGGSVARNVVRGCANPGAAGFGIYLFLVNDVRIEDNNFSGCTGTGAGGAGIYLTSANRNFIRGNHASNNSSFGLVISSSTANVYSGNATPGNTAGSRSIAVGNFDGGGNFP